MAHRRNSSNAKRSQCEKGGIFLSAAFTDTKTKLRWRCAKGHEWEKEVLNWYLSSHVEPYCRGAEQALQL